MVYQETNVVRLFVNDGKSIALDLHKMIELVTSVNILLETYHLWYKMTCVMHTLIKL